MLVRALMRLRAAMSWVAPRRLVVTISSRMFWSCLSRALVILKCSLFLFLTVKSVGSWEVLVLILLSVSCSSHHSRLSWNMNCLIYFHNACKLLFWQRDFLNWCFEIVYQSSSVHLCSTCIFQRAYRRCDRNITLFLNDAHLGLHVYQNNLQFLVFDKGISILLIVDLNLLQSGQNLQAGLLSS